VYLLYRHERLQHEAWHRDALAKAAAASSSSSAAASSTSAAAAVPALSRVYGPEHLLRMFVKLPQLLAHITLSPAETQVLQLTVADFMRCVVHPTAGRPSCRFHPSNCSFLQIPRQKLGRVFPAVELPKDFRGVRQGV